MMEKPVSGEARIPGFCGLCVSRCGCMSVVRDGVLERVEPDPAHPTGSGLCVKGRAAPSLVASPSRLLYPMRRTRPKDDPDPGWERISWDAALDTIAGALKEAAESYGPESVAFSITTRSGTPILDSFNWILRLANAFGTPNSAIATEHCNWHKDVATKYTFGSASGMPEFDKTGCILLWGFNPSTCWLSFATEAVKARRRGARTIVVDPNGSGLASGADLWLAPRPGTDGALALGLARVMITEGWFDREFVTGHTNGPLLVRDDNGKFLTEADVSEGGSTEKFAVWDTASGGPVFFDKASGGQAPDLTPALTGSFAVDVRGSSISCTTAFGLYTSLCSGYTPEEVERITGVPAEDVKKTARLIRESGPVSYYAWTGVAQHSNATQTNRAINVLYALTGYLDSPGGNVYFDKPPVMDVTGAELLDEAQRAKALGLDTKPLGPPRSSWIVASDLYRAILDEKPYPVRAAVGFGQNLLSSQPGAEVCERAMKKLGFYAHADLFINPTARYADIVLPVASSWEREGLCPGFQITPRAEGVLQLRPRAVEPRGESRSDTWIVFELASRLGLNKYFFGGDMEAALESVVKPSGVSVDTLRKNPRGVEVRKAPRYRKYLEKGFATPTGRVEVYSETFLMAGEPPLPEYVEPAVSPASRPELAEEYPLVLCSKKVPPFVHSQHRGIPELRMTMPEPLVELHPEAAEKRGISDGDWVAVKSPAGRMKAKAHLKESFASGVVFAQYGWWEGSAELGLPGYDITGPDASNYSTLIDLQDSDPVSGSVSMRSYLCDVEKL